MQYFCENFPFQLCNWLLREFCNWCAHIVLCMGTLPSSGVIVYLCCVLSCILSIVTNLWTALPSWEGPRSLPCTLTLGCGVVFWTPFFTQFDNAQFQSCSGHVGEKLPHSLLVSFNREYFATSMNSNQCAFIWSFSTKWTLKYWNAAFKQSYNHSRHLCYHHYTLSVAVICSAPIWGHRRHFAL